MQEVGRHTLGAARSAAVCMSQPDSQIRVAGCYCVEGCASPAHPALPTMCRFAGNTSVALVTHGLALRLFLMRWLHWSVDDFL